MASAWQVPTFSTRLLALSSGYGPHRIRDDDEGLPITNFSIGKFSASKFSASRTGREGIGVSNRRGGGSQRVEVVFHRTGQPVGHCQVVFDIGCSCREDPEAIVETATVEHLDEHFEIVGVEEKEQTRVVGLEQHGLAVTDHAAEITPRDFDPESALIEAQVGGTGDTKLIVEQLDRRCRGTEDCSAGHVRQSHGDRLDGLIKCIVDDRNFERL